MWFDPGEIRFKITPHDDLRSRQGGDWDIGRRFPVERSAKYRSIVQRYSNGTAWEETELFRDLYARRFANGESVRGEATMEGLIAQYNSRVDGMFEDMKRHGFVASGNPLIRLLIGRNGEVFIGNQGNHRLAMAHVLGLKRIAGEIICRHQMA